MYSRSRSSRFPPVVSKQMLFLKCCSVILLVSTTNSSSSDISYPLSFSTHHNNFNVFPNTTNNIITHVSAHKLRKKAALPGVVQQESPTTRSTPSRDESLKSQQTNTTSANKYSFTTNNPWTLSVRELDFGIRPADKLSSPRRLNLLNESKVDLFCQRFEYLCHTNQKRAFRALAKILKSDEVENAIAHNESGVSASPANNNQSKSSTTSTKKANKVRLLDNMVWIDILQEVEKNRKTSEMEEVKPRFVEVDRDILIQDNNAVSSTLGAEMRRGEEVVTPPTEGMRGRLRRSSGSASEASGSDHENNSSTKRVSPMGSPKLTASPKKRKRPSAVALETSKRSRVVEETSEELEMEIEDNTSCSTTKPPSPTVIRIDVSDPQSPSMKTNDVNDSTKTGFSLLTKSERSANAAAGAKARWKKHYGKKKAGVMGGRRTSSARSSASSVSSKSSSSSSSSSTRSTIISEATSPPTPRYKFVCSPTSSPRNEASPTAGGNASTNLSSSTRTRSKSKVSPKPRTKASRAAYKRKYRTSGTNSQYANFQTFPKERKSNPWLDMCQKFPKIEDRKAAWCLMTMHDRPPLFRSELHTRVLKQRLPGNYPASAQTVEELARASDHLAYLTPFDFNFAGQDHKIPGWNIECQHARPSSSNASSIGASSSSSAGSSSSSAASSSSSGAASSSRFTSRDDPRIQVERTNIQNQVKSQYGFFSGCKDVIDKRNKDHGKMVGSMFERADGGKELGSRLGKQPQPAEMTSRGGFSQAQREKLKEDVMKELRRESGEEEEAVEIDWSEVAESEDAGLID